MNQVSRRSFAESLAVAALAPLIGVRPEAIRFGAWTAPASHPVGVDAIAAPTLPTVAWPLDAAFDKVYPDFPGGNSIGGAANLSGVPGLFLMNGVARLGCPPACSSPAARWARIRCWPSGCDTRSAPAFIACVRQDCECFEYLAGCRNR